MIWPTRIRGFSDAIGSWKTIIRSRADVAQRAAAQPRDVAAHELDRPARSCRSAARCSARASTCRTPTRRRCRGLARGDLERTPSTALTRPISFLKTIPRRDREMLLDVRQAQDRLAARRAHRAGTDRRQLAAFTSRVAWSRWQAARWPLVPIGASAGGGSCRQPSITYGQRGWNRQPGGRVQQARRRARDRHQAARGRAAARHRRRADPRCTGAAAARRSPGRALLDDPAGVHHDHVVAQLGDDAEIVRDHDDGGPELGRAGAGSARGSAPGW